MAEREWFYVVATPHSLPHSTSLLSFAGFVLTGHNPSVTLAEVLAVRVSVELSTGLNVLTIEVAAALSQPHTVILEGEIQADLVCDHWSCSPCICEEALKQHLNNCIGGSSTHKIYFKMFSYR